MSRVIEPAPDREDRVWAWYAWAYEDGQVVRYSSQEGDEWEDVPDDGILGMKLLYERTTGNGAHTGINFTGDDWYWRADSPYGPIWGATCDFANDLRPGRYEGLQAKQGAWIEHSLWSAVMREITGTDR